MSVLKALESKTYLTFQLEDEMFAVDVLNVHEVLEFTSVTKIPGVPDFVRGIINLRGMVVPVVDLRLKFNMSETVKSQSTCIIVLDIGFGENKMVVGALADSVHEVFEFEEGQIEPPARIGSLGHRDFILGIGKRDEQFIILLNINRVFSSEEVVLLDVTPEKGLAEEEIPEEDTPDKTVMTPEKLDADSG